LRAENRFDLRHRGLDRRGRADDDDVGLRRFDGLHRIVGHLDADALAHAGDVAEIAAHFGRIDVDRAHAHEATAGRDLSGHGGTDRAEPEMHHTNTRHIARNYSSRINGTIHGVFGKPRREAAANVPSRTLTNTNAQHPGGLTREHVIWAYRLL